VYILVRQISLCCNDVYCCEFVYFPAMWDFRSMLTAVIVDLSCSYCILLGQLGCLRFVFLTVDLSLTTDCIMHPCDECVSAQFVLDIEQAQL
jgi:hypothetical protein